MYPVAVINLYHLCYPRLSLLYLVTQVPRVYPILSPDLRYEPISALPANQSAALHTLYRILYIVPHFYITFQWPDITRIKLV